MLQTFRKYRALRIAVLLAILGGFTSGCFFEDHDHHHHEHDHDWDEHHY